MKKAIAALCCIVVAGSAHSELVIDRIPGRFEGTENISFKYPGLLDTGPLVQGITSETFVIADYFGAGEDLTTGVTGLQAADGGFTAISIDMNDPTLGMSAYHLCLNVIESTKVTLHLLEQGVETLSESFQVGSLNPNYFRIYATEGEVMSRIMVSSHSDISAITQNRVAPALEPVPEPASILALGSAALFVLLRRKTLNPQKRQGEGTRHGGEGT